VSIKEWFKTKRRLRKENQQLTEKIFADARTYEEHLADLEVRFEKRNKQFRTLQNILADTVDIPLSAFSQEIAKIKQELGILKATENKTEAQLVLLSSYHRVASSIALQEKIPYQELESLQEALEQLATANQELQQWSGEGKDRYVKPQSYKRSDHG
jgi:phage shock protein A